MKKTNLSYFKQTMDDFQAKGYKPKDVTMSSLVVFFGAGADLVIAFDILHEKSSIFISDHPTDAGFISYSKIQ